MKKMFVLLMVMLMTVAGIALAEGSVNSDRAAAYDLPSLMGSKAVSKLRASVEVSGAMKCGSPIKLSVNVSGGTAPYKYEYYVMTEDEYLDGLSNIYFKSNSNEQTLTLVQPGYYYILIRVTDAAGKTATCYNFDMELPVTPEYPTLQSVVNRLAAQCKASCSTEYERALWVHDYIINHANYDVNTCYYSADGVLLRGTGACDSYRLAMEMLLNAVGIKCGTVHGGNHAWNIAYIEGEWYMIDATWDDPANGGSSHSYFCVTTEIIRKDHTIAGYTTYNAPCTSLECNYAVRTGQTERWMNEDAMGNNPLTAQVEAALQNGQSEFTLTTPKMYATSLTGNSFTSSNSSWQLAWPATAYSMSQMTWEVADTQYELQVTCDIPSKTMKATVLNAEILSGAVIEEEEAEVTACIHEYDWQYTSNGDGTHTVICTGCNEPIERSLHHVAGGACSCCGDSVTQMKLPGMLKAIEDEAFEGTFAYSVVVPSGCTSIGSRAFADSNTRVFVMPSSISSISTDAFDGCSDIAFQASEGSYAAEFAAAHGIKCIF